MLDVQAQPCAVYRLGKPNPANNGGRLLKIVLPASVFQHVALGKWKQLRDDIRTKAKYKRLLIRPSLTKEELEKEREERNKKWKMKEMNNVTTRGSGK